MRLRTQRASVEGTCHQTNPDESTMSATNHHAPQSRRSAPHCNLPSRPQVTPVTKGPPASSSGARKTNRLQIEWWRRHEATERHTRGVCNVPCMTSILYPLSQKNNGACGNQFRLAAVNCIQFMHEQHARNGEQCIGPQCQAVSRASVEPTIEAKVRCIGRDLFKRVL